MKNGEKHRYPDTFFVLESVVYKVQVIGMYF
jgi:hypothetical protein